MPDAIAHDVDGSLDRVLSPDDLAQMVSRVRNRDPEAMEQLYTTLIRRAQRFLRRKLPGDVAEDRAHNVFVITVSAILDGRLREAERLPGFVSVVGRRQMAAVVRSRLDERLCSAGALDQHAAAQRLSVDDVLIKGERQRLLAEALRRLAPRDREILLRFYIEEQTQEEICRAMSLTPTQFRLRKSRAKARLRDTGRFAALPSRSAVA